MIYIDGSGEPTAIEFNGRRIRCGEPEELETADLVITIAASFAGCGMDEDVVQGAIDELNDRIPRFWSKVNRTLIQPGNEGEQA